MRLPEHLKSWAKETHTWKAGLLISLMTFLLASGPSSGQSIGTSSDYVMVFDKTCFKVTVGEKTYLVAELRDGNPDLKRTEFHHIIMDVDLSCGRYVKKGDLK